MSKVTIGLISANFNYYNILIVKYFCIMDSQFLASFTNSECIYYSTHQDRHIRDDDNQFI